MRASLHTVQVCTCTDTHHCSPWRRPCMPWRPSPPASPPVLLQRTPCSTLPPACCWAPTAQAAGPPPAALTEPPAAGAARGRGMVVLLVQPARGIRPPHRAGCPGCCRCWRASSCVPSPLPRLRCGKQLLRRPVYTCVVVRVCERVHGFV